MNKSITVYEFGTVSKNSLKAVYGEKTAETAIKQLKKFISSSGGEDGGDLTINDYGVIKDASACMALYGDNAVRVKNYVGTISLPCGVTIEVLPKIAEKLSVGSARNLVVEMLKACSDIWYKTFNNANLSVEKINLFEVYIALFLNEVGALYKKGLRAGYVPHEDNENFLKGKLVFSEHIKRNLAHGEKFYVRYDEFSFDRAENRLIKTALKYLLGKSNNDKNKRDLRKYLLLFDGISLSENIKADFDGCGTGREVKDYERVIKLCRVILNRKSFTMYSGDSDVAALMFPMETLFERYVAKEMGKAVKAGWKIYPQSAGKQIFLFNERKFLLRPDILLEGGKDRIIVDTKWKKLNPLNGNYGVSQADIYQMYVYHTRFGGVREAVLLYPYYGEAEGLKELSFTVSEMNVTIYVAYFDLIKYLAGKPFKECVVGLKPTANLFSVI